MLAAWRVEHHGTQVKAARAYGVSQPAWSEWENDHAPSLEHAFGLEEFTGGAVSARGWHKPKRAA